MNLYNISKSDLASRTLPAGRQQLRAGQIIQGKVLKLYPENKADIQLGGKRLIASLEVGLQAGAKYHFQVQSSANLIQLKVLGEELKGNTELDISRLLHQLGLRNTKANTNLLNSFFQAKVPFDQQQLTQAAQLLKNQKDKPAAIRTLTEMIARKLPVTLPVFQGLSEAGKASVTNQLTSVIQHMRSPSSSAIHSLTNQNIKDQLINSLSHLVEKPVPFKTALTQFVQEQNQANGPALLRTFQGLSLVPLHIEFPEWNAQWEAFSGGKSGGAATRQNLPFQLSEQSMMNVLSAVNAEKTAFVSAINDFLDKWGKQINFHQFTQSGMSNSDFFALEQSVRQDILSRLPENQDILVRQLVNSPQSLSVLYQALQSLGKGDELAHLTQFIQRAGNDAQFIDLTPKQQFLQHQNLFMQSFGFDYERQLTQFEQANRQTETIKGLLLQLISNTEGNQTETNQKLLHFINGMQMKSVNETQSLLQANIQIPAERLGLIKDIELEFEGRKKKNGEIDPDFCRILFHLHLQRLDETVIDMNIHQRKISLTVFNNHNEIHLAGNLLKNKLTESLEDLGYELTALQYKKIEEKSRTGVHFDQPLYEPENKGVDFRI